MTKEELKRRLRWWNRINDLKKSKDAIISQQDLEEWKNQLLPGEASRDADLRLAKPSKVKKGDTWANVQTAISLTVDQRPLLQFIAAEENDVPKAIVLQNVLDYIWDKNKADMELYYTALSAVSYGTGIMKVFYKCDKREIKDIELYNPETKELKYNKKSIVEFNDIAIENVDIANFFPDDRARDMREAIDCAERYVISKEQFEMYFVKDRYKNINKVLMNSGWFQPTETDMQITSPFADYTNDKVEIVICHNKLLDERIVYANGIEIEYTPIPYRHKSLPYARVIFAPRGGKSFWGIGISELTKNNQAALDTMLNIMIDREKLSLNKPILVGAGEDYNVINKIEPGQMIPVADASNFKELNIQGIENTHLNFIDYLSQDGRRQVGAEDSLSGMKAGGTATENAIQKESGLRRMKIFLDFVEDMMYDVGRLCIANIQQFYSEPIRMVKIVGGSKAEKLGIKAGVLPKEKAVYRKLPINLQKVKGEFQENLYEEAEGKYFEITPDDISGNFEVKVVANSSIPVSRELETKKWQETIAILSGSAGVKEVNWTKVIKELFDSMGKNGADYIVNKQAIDEQMNGLAEEENIRMMAGENIPSTKGATQSHTSRHQALWESSDFETLDNESKKIIIEHAKGELMEHQASASQQQFPNAAPMGNTPQGVGQSMGMGGTNNAGAANATREQMGMPNANATAQPNQQISI